MIRHDNERVVSFILAGGEGKRLHPLTADRCKPAVPFGGRYRLIDFVLSNFVNSGLFKIKVLTQYKSSSLILHLSQGWQLSAHLGHYIDVVPAQMRRGPQWFQGNADAVFQNLNILADENPPHVAVFGSDHIYMMDISQMLDHHIHKKADLTLAAIPVPLEQATSFGVLEVDSDGRIVGFEEKPEHPKSIPGQPDKALASMGNYIFETNALLQVLHEDAQEDGAHDFGKSIIPKMISQGRPVYMCNFDQNQVPGVEDGEIRYWRDVGTIDNFWEASMDLVSITPTLNLYNRLWPMRTVNPPLPPAKFVFADRENNRVGVATNSLISEGCIISGGHVEKSILSPNVRIHSYSTVIESVLFEGAEVGRHAQIRRAIIDKQAVIEPQVTIGYDAGEDRKKFTVTDSGIVVIPKGTLVTKDGPIPPPEFSRAFKSPSQG
ncbi:MAG: glucose-1-phosphate adenylyltransferase [Candidatus Binatota bacterium]